MSFQTCKHCGREWSDRDAFLADAELPLTGCQVDTDAPAHSVIVFDHRAPGCGTTLTIRVTDFEDLYTGPRHKVNWAPSAKCFGLCFDPENLDRCSAECSCAYVREILQAVRERVGARS